MKTNSRARYEGKAIRNELDKQLLYINTIVDKRQLFLVSGRLVTGAVNAAFRKVN